MKIIKRYTNRKLYDTERSTYVTLDEIAEMVRDGEEVKIIDNRSGEDLTTVTMAQILYEEEKKDRKLLPLQAFRMILQSPADLLNRISRPVTDLRDQTQQQVEQFRRRAQAQQEELTAPLREFLDNIQRSIEDTQTRLDERLKDAVDALTHVPDLSAEMAALQERIDRLEREVRQLNALLERLDAKRDTANRHQVRLPGESVHDRLP